VKVGDLVKVHVDIYSTYTRQGQIGLVIREPTAILSMLVQWADGVSIFARPDHLEVVNEAG
jgi:hypothetical protein